MRRHLDLAAQLARQLDDDKVPAPISLASRRVYHFTHIDNLPALVTHGLLARNHPDFDSTSSRSVADEGLQQRRSRVAVPCGPGGWVHDYVPLYFGARSPMLFAITERQGIAAADLVYFEFPIALAERENAVFTWASAHTIGADGFFSDPSDLTKLDWQAIDCQEPESLVDSFRHRRMAELLVHWHLPIGDAVACVTNNESAVQKIKNLVDLGSLPAIEIEAPERLHWF